MVTPTIRGNGEVIWPKNAVLPKKTTKVEEYVGSIKVIEQFNNKSEVNESDWQDELAPDRPFKETLDAVNKDPRCNLSNETYNQMILGKGLKVTAKNEKIVNVAQNSILSRVLVFMGLTSLVSVVYTYTTRTLCSQVE